MEYQRLLNEARKKKPPLLGPKARKAIQTINKAMVAISILGLIATIMWLKTGGAH
jgi:hypothetical protein